MITKTDLKNRLVNLIADYKKYNPDHLESMSEDDTRAKFIDPLLKTVLGWDEQEIDRQKSIETKGNIKHADYSYPTYVPKIIVEAKKLKAPIENGDYDQQVLNYAYSKAVNWAVLTNFKIFKVWYVTKDKVYPFCNIEILDGNMDYTVEKLYWLYKDNLIDGNLDEEAKRTGIKLQDISITQDLAVSLNTLRAKINKYISSEYRDKYSETEREELTQGIINRLIFIKKVEAEGLEENKLEQLARNKESDIYKGLKNIFLFYRDKYDSDIFGKPNQESEAERITIKDKTVTELLTAISHPQNSNREYNFAAIDSDVLGNIYENYLAYIQKGIKLVGGKGKRKSQGIYYTPKNIVEYITKNTLGEILKTTSIGGIKKLKVLDPACGSGSFLTAAITLLNDYYSKNYKNYDSLSLKDKLDLIKNNIFGVDLDEKAIAIAELNIYLKLLTQRGQHNIIHPTDLLPELRSNLKVGNSLIDNESVANDKAFKWQEEFSAVMENGGFDIVMGNPPYIMVENLQKDEREYMMSNFETALKRFDIYIGFIEKAIKLSKTGGIIGFIIPYQFLTQDYAQKMREYILKECTIRQIVDLSEQKIFQAAAVRNIILIVEKGKRKIKTKIVHSTKPNLYTSFDIDQDIFEKVPEKRFRTNINENNIKILDKILSKSISLGRIAIASWGARGVPKEKFQLDTQINKMCKKMIKGENVFRYSIRYAGKWLLYDTKKLYRPAFPELFENEKLVFRGIVDKQGMVVSYDNDKYYTDHSLNCLILKYLLKNKEPSFFGQRKIVLKEEDMALSQQFNLKFLLGVINSKLINFYFKLYFSDELHVYPEMIEQLPVPDAPEAEQRLLISFVDKMLQLNKSINELEGKETDKKIKLGEEINKTNEKINELVYKIYGITEEEKKIIEENIALW
ncbi:MAG: N-6 DNA methylase [Candidatus Micrarchaeales archaeon]